MSSFVTTTRDAVVLAIQNAMTATTLTPTINTIGAYDQFYNLKDLTGGQVIVIPQKMERQPLTRHAARQKILAMDIAVQFKAGTAGPTTAVLDPYMNLAEQIATYFERGDNMANFALSNGGVCTGVAHSNLFVDEMLRNFGTFCSVVTLTITLNAP